MDSLFLQLIQPFPLEDKVPREREGLSVVRALGGRHGIFPLVYSRLQHYARKYPEREDIRAFLSASEGIYLSAAARSLQQEVIEGRIVSLLAQETIPSAVIKGNQIAGEVYHDPNCRASDDIDILIRREDAVRVDALLAEAGYVCEADSPLIYCMSRFHHATYRCPEHDFLIEVHWNFGVPYFFSLSSEEIWKTGILLDRENTRLSPEMIVLMLLVHHHAHAFRELRILTDILWALYRYEDSIDWHRFGRTIRKTGLAKTTLISLHQIEKLWERIPEKMRSVRVLKSEMKKTGRHVPGFLRSYFQMDISDSRTADVYRDKFMARLVLDKRSDMLLSFPKTLFPLPDAIRELYGDRRNWTLPLNYMRFIKWRVKDWTNPVKNAKTPV